MEQEFVRWLRQQITPTSEVLVGIGDDAAVLRPTSNGKIVVTTDMLMDGVDFDLQTCDPVRVGRKALAVNLSDLAAMAARPIAAFVSVALPRSDGLETAKRLYTGILKLAQEFDIALAGGDTNSWTGPLVINVTVLGAVTERGPLLRSGARPGDAILVTGSLGGSILNKHFDFTPRVREALQLHAQFDLRAGIDVSDGLALDVSRLAQESGCGAELDLNAIPVSDAAVELSERSVEGGSPLEHALGDGEDFELVLAASPGEADRILQIQPLAICIHRIGKFIEQPGLWSVSPDGHRSALSPRGYEHSFT